MTLRFLVCAAAFALLLPATASAAPPRSAQEFADAAGRLAFAIAVQEPAIERSLSSSDFVNCEGALERRVPRRAKERYGHVVALAIIQPLFQPIMPSLRQFVADLDAVPTQDRVLRSGRAAWRETVAVFDTLPVLEDPCGQLTRWSASGFDPAQAPPVPLRTMRTFLAEGAFDGFERKVRAAARRLRQLGISRRAARRFAGDDVVTPAEAPSR